MYIDGNYNIKKLSMDMAKTNPTFMERKDCKWRPQCVYWSINVHCGSAGRVYIIYTIYTKTVKATRTNLSGQLTQAIQHDNTGRDNIVYIRVPTL